MGRCVEKWMGRRRNKDRGRIASEGREGSERGWCLQALVRVKGARREETGSQREWEGGSKRQRAHDALHSLLLPSFQWNERVRLSFAAFLSLFPLYYFSSRFLLTACLTFRFDTLSRLFGFHHQLSHLSLLPCFSYGEKREEIKMREKGQRRLSAREKFLMRGRKRDSCPFFSGGCNLCPQPLKRLLWVSDPSHW